MTNKTFWKTVRTFLSNKGTHDNPDIILDENGVFIKDNRELSEILNNFYINIVDQTTGMKPSQDSFSKTDSVDEQLDIIIEKYKAHPSTQKIKDNNPFLSHFSLSCATEDMILRILLSLNVTKGAGYDTLPPKVIRSVSPIIASPLTGIIYLSSIKGIFPDLLKTACVVPAFKKEDRYKKENYRPISILNTFSKVFERFVLDQLIPFFNETMSKFLSAYRKNVSCQNILLRLMEQWREYLDNNKLVGAVFNASLQSLPLSTT